MAMNAMFHRGRSGYRALLLAALSVFMLGSNYCLLAALASSTPGGHPLACHTSQPVSAHSGDEGCCHSTPATTSDESPAPPASGFPCCIQIASPAPVAALSAPLTDATTVVIADLEAMSAPRFCGRPIALVHDPPPTPLHAPPRGRAPPLS
jgi:hypothetical protein